MRKRWWATASAAVVGLGALLAPRPAARTAPAGEAAAPAPIMSALPAPEPPGSPLADEGEEPARGFRAPSGEPSGLSCEAARGIVAQARRHLAYEPSEPSPRALADGTADWLDPHGLWSAAPDSPVGELLQRRARDLLRELEGGPRPASCAAARDVGASLASWVSSIRRDFDRARLAAPGSVAANEAASESVFESGTVTQRARTLAARLGERVGAVEQTLGAAGAEYGVAARERFFPELDADGWARVVLAAAVRAYVPLVDPHGAWAPADEEASVYEVDLEAQPPARLWEKCARTAMGVRVDGGARAPLEDGDLVLSLGGIATGGLTLEQVEQLALAVADGKAAPTAAVLRKTKPALVTLALDVRSPRASAPTSHAPFLAADRVPYGAGEVLVVAIPDVHDDLGEELARTLLRERQGEGRPRIVGVTLDLRGNGGGSTDGAVAALGLFLPGAALFPMKRRDGTIETDRAPELPAVDRWAGPVATLVDGDTASAAEMLSGALTAYRRGPSVGGVTFGKGCAQEYLDDDASAGVLRLTTLLYALPDGAPVQRVGLVPTYRFSFSPLGAPESRSGVRDREREALLAHAAPTWRGPDVRDVASARRAETDGWLAPWPSHGGTVGPCKEPEVCRALRLLGAPPGVRRVSRDRTPTQPR